LEDEPNYRRTDDGLCDPNDPLFVIPCPECKSPALDYGYVQEVSEARARATSPKPKQET